MTSMEMFEKGLSHACIIQSQDRDAARNLALERAMALLCGSEGPRPCRECRDCRKVAGGVHPDLIFVDRALDSEGKPRREIYVGQIRAVIAEASILPNEAGRKVFVFPEADFMNENAQNAMLKLLEEPPAHAAFILCVSSMGSLLDTIISRCEKITVNSRIQTQESGLAAEFIAAAAGSREALLSFCAANGNMNSQNAREFLDSLRSLLSDMLCFREPDHGLSRRGMAHLLDEVESLSVYLDANVGVKHVFGYLQTLDRQKLK